MVLALVLGQKHLADITPAFLSSSSWIYLNFKQWWNWVSEQCSVYANNVAYKLICLQCEVMVISNFFVKRTTFRYIIIIFLIFWFVSLTQTHQKRQCLSSSSTWPPLISPICNICMQVSYTNQYSNHSLSCTPTFPAGEKYL